MFILLGQYYLEDDGSQSENPVPGQIGSVAASSTVKARSDFVGVAVPPAQGCASSHGEHGAASASDAAESGSVAHAGH